MSHAEPPRVRIRGYVLKSWEGIGGAMQHIAGMKDAGLIIAINTDPTAPIFEVAHYGFTVNVLELLPAVMKELRGG